MLSHGIPLCDHVGRLRVIEKNQGQNQADIDPGRVSAAQADAPVG